MEVVSLHLFRGAKSNIMWKISQWRCMSSNVVVVLINSLLTMLWRGPGYEVWNSVVIVDI